MRTWMVLGVMIAVLSAGVAMAQDGKMIRGEVIDVSCYVMKVEKGRGEAHKTCAIACAKAGEPVGILDEKSGKVYLAITSDHSNPADKLIPLMAKTVDATGMIYEKAGVTAIDIKDVKEVPAAPAAPAAAAKAAE
jgi:hypothetical protein